MDLSITFKNALPLGADIIIHSTSKYIAGHSDALGGAVCVNDDDLFKRMLALREGKTIFLYKDV